jgi:glycosyltransferase involved in cell wall biosynthesis
LALTVHPLISVIVPAFNAENTILRALESVERQSYRPLEVVVADDASNDRTVEIVEGWSGLPVSVVKHAENQGPGATRNSGIRIAQGDYLAFLDADDEWNEEKLALQLAVIAEDPDISLVSCNADWVAPGGDIVGTIFDDAEPLNGPDAWKRMLAYSFVSTPCVLARRKTVLDAGSFNEKLLIAQDQDMWIRLALRGSVHCLPETLVRINISPGSHIRRHAARELEFLWPMIEGHLNRNKDRLSKAEKRSITAIRMASIGANLVDAQQYRLATVPLLRAFFVTFNIRTLWLMLHVLPPVRWVDALRRRIRSAVRADQKHE